MEVYFCEKIDRVLTPPRGVYIMSCMKKKINKDRGETLSPEVDISAVVRRIKNVQGQLGGVSRMVEEGKDCVAVVTQLKASRAGIERVLEIFLETKLHHCINPSLPKEKKEEVKRILAELTK